MVQENQDCETVLLAISLKLLTQIEEEFREIPHHKPSELHDGEAGGI
jgi:hypothetical protein